MKCPRCDVLLNEITKANVLVDACPRCLGIWLDRGELEKIGARLREIERDWSDAPPRESRDYRPEPGREWRRDDDDDDYRGRRKKKWSDIFDVFD